jgi:hypothetical protein
MRLIDEFSHFLQVSGAIMSCVPNQCFFFVRLIFATWSIYSSENENEHENIVIFRDFFAIF